MVGYDIDYTAIIRYVILELAFGELTKLSFPYLVYCEMRVVYLRF